MSSISIEEQIEQLNGARRIAAQDPKTYPQIVQGILPIVERPEAKLRQWCATFFMDAFACEDLDERTKTDMAVWCIDGVLSLLRDPQRDHDILKPTITVCCCMYPLLFSYICSNASEGVRWTKTLQIKTRVLELWDIQHLGVQAACIKFVQQVISVQSYGSRDPRLSGQDSEVSLSSVPPGHPLIEPSVEAEALGLLDRLLFVFSEEKISAPKITCTLNALSALIRSRPASVPKIMRTLLEFDSWQKVATVELEYKFIDKGIKLLFTNLLRHNLVPKWTTQVQKYLVNLSESRASAKLKKRLGESLPESANKRARHEQPTMPINSCTTMPSGPSSFSSLFTLINPEDPLVSFNARELTLDIAVNIALAGIAAANPQLLDNCLKIVKARYKSMLDQGPVESQSNQYPMDGYVDEDEFDVDNMAVADEAGPEIEDEDDDEEDKQAALIPASSFHLAPPRKLSQEARISEIGKVVDRLVSYSSFTTTVLSSGAAKANKGIDRVAVSEWNKDTWIIIASRIVTRGLCESIGGKDIIRQHIFNYVMGNFRDRLEVIVSWLTEEWFNEYARSQQPVAENESNYYIWTSKMFDQIIPLLESDDSRGFLRLLSDVPALSRSLINKIRSLCIDPDRAQIGFRAIKFLILLKPPVKEFCLDLLEDLYINGKFGCKKLV
jgi:symplekin